MWTEDDLVKHQLCVRLDNLFRDVHLGDGVSLHEAYLVDTSGSDTDRRRVRAGDETLDWRKLIGSDAFSAQSFCFMDAQGRLFHIPACLATLLIADVPETHPGVFDAVLFVLPMFGPDEFALFGRSRLAVICDVLQHLRIKTNESYFAQLDESLRVLNEGCDDAYEFRDE